MSSSNQAAAELHLEDGLEAIHLSTLTCHQSQQDEAHDLIDGQSKVPAERLLDEVRAPSPSATLASVKTASDEGLGTPQYPPTLSRASTMTQTSITTTTRMPDVQEVQRKEHPFPSLDVTSATLAKLQRPFTLLRRRRLSATTANPSRALPPIDGGRQAWTFVAAATLLETLIWGMGAAFGAFQDYHLSSPESPLYGSSSASIAAVGSLITAGQYFSPFLFTGLLSAFPHRIPLFSVITLSTSVISLLGASFNPTVLTSILLQGFLSGWAGGAFYTPAMLWLPQWFDERRGLATGLIFLGSGIGGILWPFVINALLTKMGFSWTLRCLSLIQATLGATIMFFLKPRIPISAPGAQQQQTEEHEGQESEGSGEQTSGVAAPPTTASRHDTSRRKRNLLRAVLPVHSRELHTPLGMANASLQFVQSAAFWSVSYYIAPYATSLGFSGSIPTAILAAFNAASAVSYVVTGKLCDVMPHPLLVLICSSAGSLLVGVLFGFARSLAMLTAFAISFGLLNGGFSTTMSPMTREIARFGKTSHPMIFLEFMALRGLGGVAGPLISSTLYEASSAVPSSSSNPSSTSASQHWGADVLYGSHGIGPVIIFSTTLCAVAALISLLSIPFRRSAFRTR